MGLCIGQFLGNLGDLGFLQLKSRKQPKLLLKLPGLPLLPFSRPFWKFLQQSQSVSLPRGFAGSQVRWISTLPAEMSQFFQESHFQSRILVANRGEIAIRIIRASHVLQMEAISVYSFEDRLAIHRLSWK